VVLPHCLKISIKNRAVGLPVTAAEFPSESTATVDKRALRLVLSLESLKVLE
jgi:hypothetical protein